MASSSSANGFNMYSALVELPSVSLPLLLELGRPYLQLPTWTLLVTCTEMVLSLRLLQEGIIIPPLRRLVRVLSVATPNIIAFLLVPRRATHSAPPTPCTFPLGALLAVCTVCVAQVALPLPLPHLPHRSRYPSPASPPRCTLSSSASSTRAGATRSSLSRASCAC